MRWLVMMSLIAACWTGPVEPPPATPSPQPHLRDRPYRFDSLSLERTGCLGPCPAYTVTIFANGAVRWVGEANVASPGVRTGRVSGAQLATLERKLEEVALFTYDENGAKRQKPQCTKIVTANSVSMQCDFTGVLICSDTSHAIVTFVQGRKQHRVDDPHCDRGGDPALVELERWIDEVAGTRDWIGG